jgi:predicted DNA-binding protein YlxM (UPF0122 family)
MVKRSSISCEELERLYLKESISAPEIAARVGCSTNTIYTHLVKCGVQVRSMSEAARLDRGIEIPRDELYELYVVKHLSFAEIARQYKCDTTTIHKRLKAYNLNARPAGGSAHEHPKKDFSGGLCEKAYLIGLRLGDLHVEEGNWAIRVRCTSTHREQIELIKGLFAEYGGIWVSEPREKRGVGITVHLNRSFEFLLPQKDEIEQWILNDDNAFMAFWAGYVDAEGSFIVSRNRAYFKVDSGDKGILNQAWLRLATMGLKFPQPKLIRPAGTWIDQFHLASKRDLWRLATEQKNTLFQLCVLLSPYLRHQKRIRAMEAVRANVASRISK